MDTEEFTHIYAYTQNRVTATKWTVFLLTVFGINFSTFLGISSLIPEGKLGVAERYLLVLGASGLTTLVVALFAREVGLEYFLDWMRDFRWDDPNREVKLVLILIAYALIELFIVSLVLALLLLFPLFVGMMVFGSEQFTFWQGFTGGLLFELIVFLWVYSLEMVKLKRKIRRYHEYANEVIRVPAVPRVYVTKFIGLTNGTVVVEGENTVLHNRVGAIEDIIYAYPYLLLRDEKNDVFLWERRTVWTFHGMMEQQEDTFVFNPEVRRRLKVSMLKQVGDDIVFKADGVTYSVREITPVLRPSKKAIDTPRRTVEEVFRTGDRWLQLVKEGGRKILIGDDMRLEWDEAVEVGLTSERLYVLSNDGLEMRELQGEKVVRHELQDSVRVDVVRSRGDGFHFVQVTNPQKQRRKQNNGVVNKYLYMETDSGRMASWRIPAEWRVLYVDGRKVVLFHQKKVYKIHRQMLPTVERGEFGPEENQRVGFSRIVQ